MEVVLMVFVLHVHTDGVHRRHRPGFGCLHLLHGELFFDQFARFEHVKSQCLGVFAVLVFDMGRIDVQLVAEAVDIFLHRRCGLGFMVDDHQRSVRLASQYQVGNAIEFVWANGHRKTAFGRDNVVTGEAVERREVIRAHDTGFFTIVLHERGKFMLDGRVITGFPFHLQLFGLQFTLCPFVEQ